MGAEPWMIDAIEMSPDYPHWGPGEDYMTTVENGWRWVSYEVDTWAYLGSFSLDDYNEVVNFYFEFDEDRSCLGVVLWYIHPRKGASKSVRVKRVERAELPLVIDYLRGAAQRNADRFGKLARPT